MKIEGLVIKIRNIARDFCAILAIFLVLLSMLQVILRIFFHIALPWIFELASIFSVYTVFIGSIVLILGNKLPKVTLIIDCFPIRFKKIHSILMSLLAIIFGIVLIIGSIDYWKVLHNRFFINLHVKENVLLYSFIFFGLALIINELFNFLNFILVERRMK